jgi:hypothetical protein
VSRVKGRGLRVEGRGLRVEGRGLRVEDRVLRVEGRGSTSGEPVPPPTTKELVSIF